MAERVSTAPRRAHLAAAAPALPGSAASAARSCAASVATAPGRARGVRRAADNQNRGGKAEAEPLRGRRPRTERGVRDCVRLQRRDGVLERRRADGSRSKRRHRCSGIRRLCHRARRHRRAERGGLWPAAYRTAAPYESAALTTHVDTGAAVPSSFASAPAQQLSRSRPPGRVMSAGAASLLRRFAAAARGSRPLGAHGGRCTSVSLSTAAMGKSSGPKFYAVRRGRTPGVFHTWAECEQQARQPRRRVATLFASRAPRLVALACRRPRALSAAPAPQVKGFAGAVHKSFQSQAAAAAYVAGVNAVSPAAAAERKRRPRSRSASPGAAPRRRLHRAAGGDEAEAEGHRGALEGFTHTLQFDGGARCVVLRFAPRPRRAARLKR